MADLSKVVLNFAKADNVVRFDNAELTVLVETPAPFPGLPPIINSASMRTNSLDDPTLVAILGQANVALVAKVGELEKEAARLRDEAASNSDAHNTALSELKAAHAAKLAEQQSLFDSTVSRLSTDLAAAQQAVAEEKGAAAKLKQQAAEDAAQIERQAHSIAELGREDARVKKLLVDVTKERDEAIDQLNELSGVTAAPATGGAA